MALSNIGATIEISNSEPATYDSTGFAALSYTEIGGVSSIAEFGKAHEVLNHTRVKTGITDKVHGAINNGDVQIQFANDSADSGQALITTIIEARSTCSVKHAKNGVTKYYTAIISQDADGETSASSIDMGMATININNEIIEA